MKKVFYEFYDNEKFNKWDISIWNDENKWIVKGMNGKTSKKYLHMILIIFLLRCFQDNVSENNFFIGFDTQFRSRVWHDKREKKVSISSDNLSAAFTY